MRALWLKSKSEIIPAPFSHSPRFTAVCLLSLVQGIPGCVPWGVCIAFLNDFMAVDKGMGVFAATLMMGALGIGGLTGAYSAFFPLARSHTCLSFATSLPLS